jgi:cobalt-zinc-cadmium efflux system outer membrane protein
MACCLAGLAAPLALAQGPEPPLSLAAALALVEQHPLVAGRRAGVEAARAKADVAGLRAPWEVAGQVQNFGVVGNASGFGTNDPNVSGFDVVELSMELGRTIETGDKPGARRRVADAETALAESVLATDLNALRAGVSAAYYGAVAARSRLELAREVAATAGDFTAVAERRVKAGAASVAEVEAARATAARRGVELLTAEAGVDAADTALGAALGLDRPRQPGPDTLPVPQPGRELPTDLAVRIDGAPSLAAASRAVSVGEAAITAAELGARPDVRVGAGVRYMKEFDAMALVAGVSVPLGMAQRAAPAAAAARADRAVAEASALGARQRLAAEVRRLELDARTAAARYAAANDEIVPRTRAAVTVLERGYALGRFSWVELAAARQGVVDAESERIAAALAYREALAGLEALLGPLGPPAGAAPQAAAGVPAGSGSEPAARP